MRAIALRYALAPACVLLAVLVYRSPAGPALSLAGLFVFAVLAAAWFGGAGPGLVAALLATFTLPELIAVNYPLLGGFLDVPRFITFSIEGVAVGWGSSRRARVLREQERYARAMSASDDGFWDWIPANDTLYTSPRLLEIYGFAPGTTFAGRNDLLAQIPFHPEDRPLLLQAFAEHFAGKTARYDVEARFIRDAETRWVHLTGVAARDRSGAVVRWTGTVRDVTERKRAEVALRQSEERYERTIAATGAEFWEWDVLADEFYVSPKLLERTGFPPGTQFTGRADFMQRVHFHPEDRAKWESTVRDLFAGDGERLSMELRITFDGELRWLQLSGICFRDAAGKVVRWTVSATDVHARKSAQEAQRESEERYERVVAATEAGFWDWDVVHDKYYVSPRLLEMAGLPPHAIIARRADFQASVPLHPEDLEKWQREIQALFASGGFRLAAELRVMLGSGTRWYRVEGMCFRDAAGNVVRWTGSAIDVTPRKLAEEALRASEQRYSLAMEASQDGHFDVNLDTGDFFTSERVNEIYGFPCGKRFASRAEYLAHLRLYPEDVERYHATLDAVMAKDGPDRFDFEYRILRPSGEVRWLRTRGKVIRDAEGRARRRTGTVADVTGGKLAEEALRNSEQRYALAMEAAGDGHTDWDLVSGGFYISPRLLEILGYAPGTSFADRTDWVRRFPFHPEDRQKWETAVAAHFAGRESHFKMEIRIVVRGEVRWTAFHFLSTRDAAGRVIRWTGSIGDVTEQKRVEEARQLSEERYALAMEVAEEGHLDWNAKMDEMFASAQARRVLNVPQGAQYRTRRDLMGRLPYHPDDRPRVSAAWRESLAGRQAEHEFDYRILRDEEPRWIRMRWKIFRDDTGAALRVVGVVSDITERKLAANELRESEARFRSLTELSSDWYWQQDENLRFTYLSGQALQLTGYSGESSLGKTRWEIVNMTPLTCSWAEHQAVLAARQPFRDLECRRVGPDGTVRYLSMSGAPIFDAQGRFRGYRGIGRNITARKQAEQALRESEARKSAMFETALDCIVSIDHEGRVVEFNPAAERTFGYRRAETLGNELADLIIPPRLRAQHRQGLARYLKRGEARVLGSRTEMPAVRADGSEFPVELAITRIATEGEPVFTAYLRDITERKQAVETLRESEARFRSLTELSSDWYWRQDEHFRFTYTSRQAEDTAAYPAEWVMGKTRWELPGITPLSFTWPAHQAALAARQPFRDLEYARTGLNGTHYVSISGAPIFDEQGVFRGYQGIGRDITERKHAEKELHARQEMLDLAQKSARAIAFEWRIGEGEGQDRWSPDLEAMYGLAPGTYDGSFETWKKLVCPDDWPAVEQAINYADRNGDVEAEYRVSHSDGSVHWLQAKGRMFFDALGKPVRIVGFMHEVTKHREAEEELRRMERQLRQAQRLEAMGTLAGGIAHDFNNILGAILGFGEMAMRDAPRASRLRRDLDSIMAAGERGRALVDRVLAFSRSGVGERVPVHVQKVVQEALDHVSAKLPPNVTLHAELRAGRAAMSGDATQVHQVLMNLATNAVQAMPAGGTLRVSLDAMRIDGESTPTIGNLAAGDYVVLRIADTGTGIPLEILDRIFDPFFTTKEVGTGTGLGLSLVHGIVTELGGAIDVGSKLGAGSVFTVYLPRSGDAPEVEEDAEIALPRGGGQRVLVVDDEEPLVKLATRTLEELGYVAVGYTSSTAALAAFRAEPQRFDAVITDERMPGLSGSTLIREVRGIRERIPIMLMSGFVGGTVTTRAREAGATEVLKKPLRAGDLASSLARVLRP